MTVKIPDDWTDEQATIVFELIDDVREAILTRYQLQIMQCLHDQRSVELDPDHHCHISNDEPF